MVGRIVGIVTIVAAVMLLAVVNMSSPVNAGPVGILAVFFLLYIVLTGILTVAAIVTNRIVVRVSTTVKMRRPTERLSWKRAYYIASVVALGPIMLIGMGSMGMTGVTEFILVTVFVCIGLFYVEKRSR